MNQHPFLSGIGLGVLTGAALTIGLTATTRKNRHNIKRRAHRAAHHLGRAVEDMTDTIGL